MRFSSRIDRILAGWCAGVLCAVLIALGALALINRTVYEPAGQVRQYFQALRAGDGARALGLLGATVPDSNAAMLDGAAAKNAVADLKDLRVSDTSFSDDGQRATVTVTYSLTGEEHSTDFQMSKIGSHWGVFDRWHIDSVELPTVEVSSPSAQAATLNNEKVAVDGGSQKFAVFYPGHFTASYESALYSADRESVSVTSATESSQTLAVELGPSDAALNSVQYQIKSQLDACASQNSLYPTGCPFEYGFTGRVAGDVSWTIEKYPEPQVSITDTGRWTIPDTEGTAKIEFTQIDLYTGKTSRVSREVTFTYSGRIEVGEEQVTVVQN